MMFFPLFFRLVHRNCLIFGTKVTLDRPTRWQFLIVWKGFNSLSSSLILLKRHKFGHFGRQQFLVFFSFFTKLEKKLFRAKKSTFHHFYPLYDLPLPTLTKIFEMPKTEVFQFF